MAKKLVVVQKSFLMSMETDYNQILSKNVEDQTESELKAFLQVLETDYKDCRRYHSQIQQSDEDGDDAIIKTYEDNDIMNLIRSRYRSFWGLLTDRLNQKQVKSAKLNETQDSNKSMYFSSEIKLRRMDLPIFDGKYEDWLPFFNLFKPTVHNNPNLEPVQKFQYLTQFVRGKAQTHIRNLPPTDESYQIAIDLLTDQYDHQRKTANVYMRKLLDYPSFETETSESIKDLLSMINDCCASLVQLKLPVNQWGYILLCVMTQKLPSKTYRDWEKRLGASRDIPKFEDFKVFLEETFRTLEMVESLPRNDRKPNEKQKTKAFHLQTGQTQKNPNKSNTKTNNKNKSNKRSCPLCKSDHGANKCSKFLNANYTVRWELVRQNKLCENCLGVNHTPETCYSYKSCVFCRPAVTRHHSLLHEHTNPDSRNNQSNSGVPSQGQIVPTTSQRNYHISCQTDRTKLLGTAQVRVSNQQGFSITVRVLIDPCSEDNYITANTVQLLHLVKHAEPSSVSVIGDEVATECPYRVNFKIQSLIGDFETMTSAAIVKKITAELPSEYIPSADCGYLNNLQLADPNYNHPGEIHLLLGSCFDAETIRPGLKKFGTHVYAQNTELGWIIRGRTSASKTSPNKVFLTKRSDESTLTEQLKRFWELEEVSGSKPQHPEETQCESLFLSSIIQRSDGHLSVDLPFRHVDRPVIGPSREIALRRFLNLEKRLESNEDLKVEYHKTMRDYIESGHMKIADQRNCDGREYFLPHHAVFKSSSTTTKVRVVFDASCKAEDGASLNDYLLTGPKLQTDIRDILFNWRKYRFALTADIAKMYRMFFVNDKHHSYQNILWRFDPKDPVTAYSLCTVTFGTSSAPYLAIRMLLYIAETNRANPEFQLAVQALEKEFYVDDFISGAHSLTDAISKQKQLRELLGKYGLDIRKWSSNSLEILDTIPANQQEISTQFSLEETEFRKTLGIYWSPKDDYFKFSIDRENSTLTELTKRKALSLIARIYDPMGWLSPCVLYAKILMQEIWKTGTDWDHEVCDTIKPRFLTFLRQLHELERIKIPRWTTLNDDESPVELIGFCDASIKGYGAVIYLENSSTVNNSTDSSHSPLILLSSKTKVAPTTLTSIPRLELCAALLLSEMLVWAQNLLTPRKVTVTAFSDSQVVLSWIRGDPSRWKVYIATRTTKIREAVPVEKWFYVHTSKNPADFASKGLLPIDIVDNDLWWYGPQLETVSEESDLTEEEQQFISNELNKKTINLCTTQTKNPFLENYSSHFKACRILKKVCHFLKLIFRSLANKYPDKKETYLFHVERLNDPEFILFRLVQKTAFADEINDLSKNRFVKPSSQIKTLHPFIDGFGILRVGGRLENAPLNYNQKHPIILPSKHQIVTNVIENAHDMTIHGEPQLTLNYLREKFHIIRVTESVKRFIDRCIECQRYAKQRHSQLMGSLPPDRVAVNKIFLNTGVDYAGPILTRDGKRRNSSVTKSYIALFVCLSTKALHLEIVSDLTSKAFLAAFRRFSGRWGRVQRMYSDRGTNFVGAAKKLKEEIYKAEQDWKNDPVVLTEFEKLKLEWLFNPAAAPHFGGLWEAGVKSVKTHLVKSIGNKSLTFEELSTVIVQIEGVLNSRPLCPLTNDPNSFVALTPSHFFLGEAITTPPEPVLEETQKSYVDRWTHIQTIRQTFWRSYLKDYLNRLQRRPKWLKPNQEFKIGDLVLLTDENSPPTMWPKALIVDLHPGSDGHTRVVSLRNSSGKTFKRVVARIRMLAMSETPTEEHLSNINTVSNN